MVGNENIGHENFVEMVLAQQVDHRTDFDAGGFQIQQELCRAGMTVVRLLLGDRHLTEQDGEVRVMRIRRP